MKEKIKFIVVKESLAQSIVSDIFTFACMFVVFWANEKYCNGNNWLSALLILSIMLFAIKSTSKGEFFYNIDDAIKYLKTLRKDNK